MWKISFFMIFSNPFYFLMIYLFTKFNKPNSFLRVRLKKCAGSAQQFFWRHKMKKMLSCILTWELGIPAQFLLNCSAFYCVLVKTSALTLWNQLFFEQ